MSETNGDSTLKLYWSGWATVVFGISIIAVYVVTGLFTGLFIGILLNSIKPGINEQEIGNILTRNAGFIIAVSTYATTAIGLSMIAIFIKLKNKLSLFEYLGLNPIRLKTVLILILMTSGLLAISIWVGEISNIKQAGFDEQVYVTSFWPPLLWLALVVCAPLFEEIFFRGFIFEGLCRSRMGITGTIIVTSLAWASLHVQYGMYEIGTIFILGIILGIAKQRTGSLWAPITIHACWNLAAIIQLAIAAN